MEFYMAIAAREGKNPLLERDRTLWKQIQSHVPLRLIPHSNPVQNVPERPRGFSAPLEYQDDGSARIGRRHVDRSREYPDSFLRA